MTIAAAYLVSEGVVFGADSSTMVSARTQSGRPNVLQLLSHSQKVFEVGENSRIGLCTWGAGSLGEISHRTAIARVADGITNDTSVHDVAEQLGNIVHPLIQNSGIEFAGYFLGGWDPQTHNPSCFKIEVRQDGPNIQPLTLGLCSFSGMPNFFTRVFKGFDPELPERLRNEIRGLIPEGNIREQFDRSYTEMFNRAAAPFIAAGYRDLPIREAIDFVYSYLHITVKATKFKFGAPACGGPIEVGFVTTDRSFRWACHKDFTSAIIEEEAGNYE